MSQGVCALGACACGLLGSGRAATSCTPAVLQQVSAGAWSSHHIASADARSPPHCLPSQVAAFALDRGALALCDWTFPQLLFILAVPVYPRQAAGAHKGRLGDSAGGALAMAAGFTAHMGE